MEGGALVESSTEVTGTASLATLGGREWVLRKLSSTEAAPAEPEITLVVDGDRVSGASGCNRYHGTIGQGETGTSLTVGPLAATRMACPPEVMDLEQRFTAALQGAQSWGFRLGDLVLHYQQGDDFGSLFFEGREPTSPGP
jgi:heat shock protein HslJ